MSNTGTVIPVPYQTIFDTNGDPVSGGLLWTYLSGLWTAQATYTDATLGTPNTNPIVADSAGRFVAFVAPGTSYKLVYETAATPPAHGSVIRTVDYVSSVPGVSTNVDVSGTAGEALTAGNAVYLSDGSGSKVAGLWYQGTNVNTYSSSAAVAVGMVPASISSGASGTIRLVGIVSGLSVSTGSTYYIGTGGAITATLPTNVRQLGIADTTSSIVLAANPGVPATDNAVNDFRLSLTTGVAVTVTDVTAATTLYCTPYRGNRLTLYDATGQPLTVVSAQFSIAVPATTSTLYDVFAYNNSGAAALELLAWTNDTTRATAIVQTTTGAWTKSGDLTRRYLGSMRTTGVSGQTEDSKLKRYLWNAYNQVPRQLRAVDATDTWNYTTAAFRQANAAATNQVDVVVGVAGPLVSLKVLSTSRNTNVPVNMVVGIGEDSTTVNLSGVINGVTQSQIANVGVANTAWLEHYPAVGRHYYAWLEYSDATGTSTWFGDGGTAFLQSGLTGWMNG